MKNKQPSFIAWRFYLVLGFVSFAAFGLLARIIDLSIFDQRFLQHQGDERVLRMVTSPGFRGMIVDRNGFPLAVSTSVYSAWINPNVFAPDKKELAELSRLVSVSSKAISAKLESYKKKHREFAYIRRSLSPQVAKKIKSLQLEGLHLQEEYRRYYPEGDATAHVLGFTNIDDKGQEGVELAYNDWLKGVPGKTWVIKDRLGRIISNVRTVQEQQAGHDLMLSIDRRIQYLAYKELLDGVEKYKAKSGSVVVLDVKTGEVLAMANFPSYNPNNRKGSKAGSYRNRAVTDTFEPGSTIKAFSVLNALESRKFTPDTIIDTDPGWIKLDKHIVRDIHPNGKLTISQILQKSSNVGVSKMTLGTPANSLANAYSRVGFGENTGIGFPGEQSGSLVHPPLWGDFTLATLSFGYGVSVTTLQLARAYAILANNGIKLPVSLLRPNEPPVGEQVVQEKFAHDMMMMLERVISKKGSGRRAMIPGYRVAGKTGTARLASGGGYEKNYVSSFVGMAPVSNPRFVVAVVINEPQGKQYYGGVVSAPIFERVMQGALRLFDVPPDEAESSSTSS